MNSDNQITSELKDLILSQVKGKTEIPGSIIGTAIKRNLGIDMKVAFGGLKRFINSHCNDDIIWVRKKGGDDIFAPKLPIELPRVSLDSREPKISGLREVMESDPDVWTAFVNPKSVWDCLVNKTNGTLHIKTPNQSVIEPYSLVKKVDREEYRRIAWEFVPKVVDETVRNELGRVLTEENFWPRWVSVLNKHKKDPMYVNWLRWREDQIYELFEKRLRLLQIPENLIASAKGQLKNGQLRESNLRKVAPIIPASTQTSEKKSGDQLKQVVKAVIDRMSDEELRRLWLPTGLLWDILNHK